MRSDRRRDDGQGSAGAGPAAASPVVLPALPERGPFSATYNPRSPSQINILVNDEAALKFGEKAADFIVRGTKRSSTNAEVAPMRRSLAATERKTAQAAAASGRGCVSQDGSGQFERRRIGRAFKPSGKLLAAIGF
jgi:hypothetical protein